MIFHIEPSTNKRYNVDIKDANREVDIIRKRVSLVLVLLIAMAFSCTASATAAPYENLQAASEEADYSEGFMIRFIDTYGNPMFETEVFDGEYTQEEVQEFAYQLLMDYEKLG